LPCATAFHVAEALEINPHQVGEAADALSIKLSRCQLGLFGYAGPEKRLVEPAEVVSPELQQAIEEGLILGRLPCAVAWVIAKRFDIAKRDVADAAEKLGVAVGQCQLGAF
jgi:hypothetical protein